MSADQAPKVKRSIWQTIKAGSGPYRRLFGYVKPYKWRFVAGVGFGTLAGAVSAYLPIVLGRVMTVVFGGAIDTKQLMRHADSFGTGHKVSHSLVMLCLEIPAIMMGRSLFSYLNAYYMAWVSNKVITDIRTQLFQKILSHSMDYFNKARSGLLMSRITNDTRMMQTALSSISADLFKQPVAIISGVGVLLYL
ncbi:MAG: ABC transporter transmembrane domain-containing protein, partial [Verrucomicrobiota bacterium]|nr:ABC transporter transmembrane domain-containing protein [Verrucomicrobiota bacterium]